jgi:beta-xylosidase
MMEVILCNLKANFLFMGQNFLLATALLFLSGCFGHNPKNKGDSASEFSGNPVIDGWYADPEGIIYDDQYWVFPTYSDAYSKQVYFDCFSSHDLVNWVRHERIIDTTEVSWADSAMWAPGVIEKDNKYYFFFAANDIQSEDVTGGIGVSVSDRPEGPYKDLLGKPLINDIVNGAQPIDQFIFKENEDTYYMFYGGWGHSNVLAQFWSKILK